MQHEVGDNCGWCLSCEFRKWVVSFDRRRHIEYRRLQVNAEAYGIKTSPNTEWLRRQMAGCTLQNLDWRSLVKDVAERELNVFLQRATWNINTGRCILRYMRPKLTQTRCTTAEWYHIAILRTVIPSFAPQCVYFYSAIEQTAVCAVFFRPFHKSLQRCGTIKMKCLDAPYCWVLAKSCPHAIAAGGFASFTKFEVGQSAFPSELCHFSV